MQMRSSGDGVLGPLKAGHRRTVPLSNRMLRTFRREPVSPLTAAQSTAAVT